MTSFNKSGSKYLREMKCLVDGKADVYSVIETFQVRCPARQHAIKKILCSGIRGKGDELQDLREARDAIDRAIQMYEALNPVQLPANESPPGSCSGYAIASAETLFSVQRKSFDFGQIEPARLQIESLIDGMKIPVIRKP